MDYSYGQLDRTPDEPMGFDHVQQQVFQIDGQALATLNKKPGKVPGEMGRRDIRVLQGIMEPAETGKAIESREFKVWAASRSNL